MPSKQPSARSATRTVVAGEGMAGSKSERSTTEPVKGNRIRAVTLVPHRLTSEERHFRIAEIAYRKAEQRGFAPGFELDDWLDAERQVSAIEGVTGVD